MMRENPGSVPPARPPTGEGAHSPACALTGMESCLPVNWLMRSRATQAGFIISLKKIDPVYVLQGS